MPHFDDYEKIDALEDAVATALELADPEDRRNEWPTLLADLRAERVSAEERLRRADPIHAILDDGGVPGGFYAHLTRNGWLYHAVQLEVVPDQTNRIGLRRLCRRRDRPDWIWSERVVTMETWEHLLGRATEHTGVCRRCAERVTAES